LRAAGGHGEDAAPHEIIESKVRRASSAGRTRALGSAPPPSKSNPLTTAPAGTGSITTADSCRGDVFRRAISRAVRAVSSRTNTCASTDSMTTPCRADVEKFLTCGTMTFAGSEVWPTAVAVIREAATIEATCLSMGALHRRLSRYTLDPPERS
jgi:hypothetical protein